MAVFYNLKTNRDSTRLIKINRDKSRLIPINPAKLHDYFT